MFASNRFRVASLIVGLVTIVAGCEKRPSLIPNNDPALRQTSAWFAADAKKRQPFPTTAPFAGAFNARAEVDVMSNTVQIVNFSDEGLTGIDVWLNQAYVVHVPKIEAMAQGKPGTRTLDFQMMFNDKGESFPTDNDTYPVKTVDILSNGKMYSIKVVVN